jgi:AraC-like DNA-binding protein
MPHPLDVILAQPLCMEYIDGNLSVLRQNRSSDTGWRNLPYTVLSYTKFGSCQFFFNNDPPLKVKENELMIVPAGITHRMTGHSRLATYYWVHLNYFVMTNLDIFSFFTLPSLLRGKPSSRIGEIIKRWILFLRKTDPGDIFRISARKNEMGFQILNELSSVIKPRPENQSKLKYMHQIQPALDRIHRDYINLAGRDELAERCNLSASQFHRVFAHAMGIGPMDYVRNLRIRRAQQLLITSDLPVTEIARLAGYNDPFIFSRYFKLKSGLSPTLYRTKIQQSLYK